MARYAFVSRLGSATYIAITYDADGQDLPNCVEGNTINWTRVEVEDTNLPLRFNVEMERDLHELRIHIMKLSTVSRREFGRPNLLGTSK